MKKICFSLSTALICSTSVPAYAQSDLNPIDIANRAVDRACQDRAGQRISVSRLEQAMRVEARLNDLSDDIDLDTDAFEEALRDRFLRLHAATSYIQAQLAVPGSPIAKKLEIQNAPVSESPSTPPFWLFDSEGHTLTCAVSIPATEPEFTSIGPVVIRRTVAELSEVGSARRSADAAQIGWERLRSTNLDGEITRTTTLTINAAVGLAIGNIRRHGMLYADYSRSRVRRRTSPIPTPEEQDGRADDVDALEIGVLGTARPAPWLRTTGRVGVTFDSIDNARFLDGGITIVPITGGLPNLGLCNFNAFRYIGLGIEGRCTAEAEVEIRHVLRPGTADLDDADELIAVGGTIGAEFRRALDLSGNPQDGPVASVSYQYLPLINGRGPDIDRFEASLAYRWWASNVGFEVGFSYADGIERKSLADENRLGLSFGIIY